MKEYILHKHTEELFHLINEAINKFLKNNPDFSYKETALNAIAMFTSTLVSAIAAGKSLEEKIKLFDELIQYEKEWIVFDHENEKIFNPVQ